MNKLIELWYFFRIFSWLFFWMSLPLLIIKSFAFLVSILHFIISFSNVLIEFCNVNLFLLLFLLLRLISTFFFSFFHSPLTNYGFHLRIPPIFCLQEWLRIRAPLYHLHLTFCILITQKLLFSLLNSLAKFPFWLKILSFWTLSVWRNHDHFTNTPSNIKFIFITQKCSIKYIMALQFKIKFKNSSLCHIAPFQ